MALLFKIKSFSWLVTILLPLTLLSSFTVNAATLLVLGDSLGASYGMPESKGWVEGLRHKIPEHTIINASVSGETSAGGLRRLPKLLETTSPDIVLVELGGNDGLRGFPPNQLKSNLNKIINLAQSSGADVLLSEVQIPPNYGPRYARSFSQVYNDLAKIDSVTLVPFFMVEIAVDPNLMQRDGIHPNEEAQPKITEFMLPWVQAAFEKFN